jgi:hypothetical protein
MSPNVRSAPRSGHKYFFVVSFSTGFARPVHRFSTSLTIAAGLKTGGYGCGRLEITRTGLSGLLRIAESTMMAFRPMRALPLLVALAIWACAVSAEAAADATLFRLYLKDGSTLVSYGEFTRVDDRVVFSMPVGGTLDEPRLQVVWIAATTVDWARTDKYAASARYQQYADTRGEDDYAILNNEVARVLSDIALSTDRARALELALLARASLAEWPRQHHGYRQEDVREIVALIDEAIANIRASGGATNFDLTLVASVPSLAPVPLEPLLGMPTLREQLDQVLRLASMAPNATERVTLLQSALAMVKESGAGLRGIELGAMRASLETRIKADYEIDRKYGKLAEQLTSRASREAARARIAGVEKALNRLEREDAKLGKRRPDVVMSLRASIEASLGDARRLRLLRDQWVLRQSIYRDYQRTVGTEIISLVKAQPQLEAIRRLDGPPLDILQSLQSRLSGGAERLERLQVSEDLRNTHNLLVGAWRFAENAANGRADAVSTGNVSRAWEASSAAAGALMLLSQAQRGIQELLELPRLK